MPTGTIRIENNTHGTPTIEGIVLGGCHWMPAQVLTNGDPIANHNVLQGTVIVPGDIFANYQIALSVRFYSPPPGMHDVIISCGRALGGANAFIGTLPGSTNQFHVHWQHHLEGMNNDIFVLQIS